MLKKKVAAAVTAALGMTAMSSANAAIGPFDFTAWGGFLGAISTIPYAYDDDSASVDVDPLGNEAQVLIFPYYTVHDGKQTSFNIRNTKDEFKAIRVRFRESKDSLDVLDFNVYLSPYDMFTMTLQQDTDPANPNGVRLTTTDTSCTFPTIPAAGVVFKRDFVSNDDLTEGYMVVTEMATFDESAPLVPTFDQNGIVTGNIVFAQGIEHTAAGVPADCSVVATAWGGEFGVGGGTMANGVPEFTQGGALASIDYAPNQDNDAAPGTFFLDVQNPDPYYYGVATPSWTLPPTGGLVGTGIVLDIAKGAALVVDPTPISGWSTWPQHYSPNDLAYQQLPTLSSGNIRVSTVSIHNFNGHEDVMHPYWAYTATDYGLDVRGYAQGINPFPVTDVLAVVSVDNEYAVTADYDSATDWTLTFPMRAHGLFSSYAYQLVQSFDPVSLGLKWNEAFLDDVYAPIQVWDREEQPDVANFSPIRVDPLALPREVNVVEFQRAGGTYNPSSSSVFGSHYPVPVALSQGWTEGWAKLYFDTYNYSVQSSRYSWWVDHSNQTLDLNSQPIPVLTWVGDADRLPRGYVPGYNGLALIGVSGTVGDIGGGTWVGEIIFHNTVVDHMDED